MQHAYNFGCTYKGWHTYHDDKITVDVIRRLCKIGLAVMLKEYQMFSVIPTYGYNIK